MTKVVVPTTQQAEPLLWGPLPLVTHTTCACHPPIQHPQSTSMTLQFSPLLVGQKRACFAAALLWLLGGGITEAQTVHLVPDRPLIARLPRQEGPAEDPQPDEVVPTPLELRPRPASGNGGNGRRTLSRARMAAIGLRRTCECEL